MRTTYEDGGQHAIFAALLKQGANLGDVSRPEALAFAGRDIVLVPARTKPRVQEAKLELEANSTTQQDPVAGTVVVASPFTLPLMAGSLPILPAAFIRVPDIAKAGLTP